LVIIALDYTTQAKRQPIKFIGSLGIAVIVTPAVALLAGGSATAAGTGGSSRQLVKIQFIEINTRRTHQWLEKKYVWQSSA
jgi:hypothetical protein